MFELSVACKYLLPRWRQISVSMISLVSMLVIALVVWLIVVFFSVKDGLENSWIEKLIALTSPVRVIPTDAYYKSYYYLVDSVSEQSNYAPKSIYEKNLTSVSDPYDPLVDEELPADWPAPDVTSDGSLKDIVKAAFLAIKDVPNVSGVTASDFETTVGNIRIRLLREPNRKDFSQQTFLEQAGYIGSFDAKNAALLRSLLPITNEDIHNLLGMSAVSNTNIQEDSPNLINKYNVAQFHANVKDLFTNVAVTELKTPAAGWRLPRSLLPEGVALVCCAFYKGDSLVRIILPAYASDSDAIVKENAIEGISGKTAKLKMAENAFWVQLPDADFQLVPNWVPVLLEGGISFPATYVEESLLEAKTPYEIRFAIKPVIQGIEITGQVPLANLSISDVKINHPPVKVDAEDSVLLPRSFKEGGVLLGDQGFLSYYSPTASTVQEQRIPIKIAGFYDPGIMPMAGKYVLASREVTSLIRGSHQTEDAFLSNGINVHFDHLEDAEKVKTALKNSFEKQGITPYWTIETYQEYEFTKDLIQQLRSEKNLFTLISTVIIIVACSNIISMLIILVNDKKVEIGILRSMGASSASIAMIFGSCGMVMGGIGSIAGICAALLTLKYIDTLVSFISSYQGYDMFNPVFYGHTLPNAVSYEALFFVIVATTFISLLAGIIPAVKASLVRPSVILRSE